MNYKQIILLVVLFLHPVLPVSAQYKELRQVVFHASEPGGTHLLSPGEGVSQELSLPPSSIPMRNTLRVTGGILQPERYRKRGEELFRQAEFQLEDNLDSLIHWHDRRSLYFGGQGEDFPRQAFNRIALDGLSTGTLTLSIPVVKALDLQVCPGGRFGVELQFYRHRQGRHHLDVYDAPDSLVFVPLPGGTYKKKIIEHAVQVPADMACVVLNIEALAFTGEVWVEAPSLLRGRDCFWHMPFAPHDMETREVNYWVGKNLSDRSWPMWQLELDGEVIFCGKVFDRASCVADFRLPLPSGQLNGRKLRLTLLREPHRQAFPYELRTLEVLQEPARPFEVIAVPPYVASGAAFGILVETNVPGQTLTAHTDSPAISPREQTVCFDEPGLHVLEFRAVQPAVDISLALSDGQRTEQVAARVNQPEPASGWIESGNGVSFTCWQGPDMRTLYVLHPRWQDSAPASFQLCLGGQSFPMQVEQGKLRPIYCANGVAISPEGNTTDVLRITPTLTGCVAVVQNTEPDELFIATASSSVPQRRSLPKAGIHTLEINFSAGQ